MRRPASGFSHIILIIVIALLAVGTAGFIVVRNHSKTTAAGTKAAPAVANMPALQVAQKQIPDGWTLKAATEQQVTLSSADCSVEVTNVAGSTAGFDQFLDYQHTIGQLQSAGYDVKSQKAPDIQISLPNGNTATVTPLEFTATGKPANLLEELAWYVRPAARVGVKLVCPAASKDGLKPAEAALKAVTINI